MIFRVQIVLLVLCLSGCTANKNEKVVLTVNHTEFTLEDFSHRLLNKLKELDSHYLKDRSLLSSFKKQLQQELITEVILENWAHKENKLPSDQDIHKELKRLTSTNSNTPRKNIPNNSTSGFNDLEKSVQILLIKNKLYQQLKKQVDVSDKAAKEYYENNKTKFAHEYIELKQIFLGSKPVAEKVLKQIKSRPADFEKLAKKYSQSVEAKEGGNLGRIKKGENKLFDALFNRPRGPIFSIVPGSQGFHIFKIIEPAKKANQSFQEAKSAVIRDIKEAKTQELYLHWLEEQVKNISVKVDDELIEAIEPSYQESL